MNLGHGLTAVDAMLRTNLREKSRQDGATCWHTERQERHPATQCPASGNWLTVATDGKWLWIACSKCGMTFTLVEPHGDMRTKGVSDADSTRDADALPR